MNNSLDVIEALSKAGQCYLANHETKTEFKELSEFDRIVGKPMLKLLGIPLSGFTAHIVTQAYEDIVHYLNDQILDILHLFNHE